MSDPEDYGYHPAQPPMRGDAPRLAYLPPRPARYRPRIGLIGAGGITSHHLRNYRAMQLDVAAICDVQLARAEQRRAEFYPEADVFQDYRDVLARRDIEVVDVATHPEPRGEIIEQALRAGKHVLSQKPFVLDLDVGLRLADLADRQGVRLAVNQNGRWAPHFSYIRQAIRQGVIGAVSSIDFSLQWDHTWTAGTPFEEIHHLLLFDFAIHWFDIACAFLDGAQPQRVYAAVQRAVNQRMKPPMLASATIDFPGAQVSLSLNGHAIHGEEDRTVVCGSHGTLRAVGPNVNCQTVTLWTKEGQAVPRLEGRWFDNGFQGTMGELLQAIEEGRAPSHDARGNLRSLELCFAATASADRGTPVVPGTVRRIGSGTA